MTAATLSRSPFAVGAAMAGPLARGGYWTLSQLVDATSWAVAQYARAPLAISLVIAATGFSVLAGSNALFRQPEHHPAPLFFSAPHQVAPVVVKPVIPAVRPRPQPVVDNQTTGSLGPLTAPDAINGDDILALQKKLAALKLFSGAPDGLFGRRTSGAIKAFELHTGRAPRGKLTREILTAVLSSSPVAEPMPAPTIVASVAPKPGTVVPLAPARTQTTAPAVAVAPAPIAPITDIAPIASTEPLQAAAPAIAAPSDADSSTLAMNSLPAAPPAPVAAAPAAPAPTMTVASTGPVPTTSAGQRLAAQMGTLPATPVTATVPAAVAPPTPISDDNAASTDPVLISKIQQALATLGFLGNNIDGLPGEATAKAIRSFQVFYDYPVTGQASPQLLDLLIQHGATI